MTSATSLSQMDSSAVRETPLRGGGAGGLLRGLFTLFGLTLRQYVHGRRWIIMGLLFLLPAAIALLVRATTRNEPGLEGEFALVFMLIPQALLPLVALVYASGMIQDEQEEQTITYLLIRPIPKWAIYGAKLAATLLTTVILTVIFTALTYAAIYAGAKAQPEQVWLRCAKAASVHGTAVVAYCCLFGLMSLYTKRTLIVGIIYAAIFEGLLANLPFGIRLITIIYYARLIAYRMLSFVIATPSGPQDIAADAWQFDIKLDPQLLEHPRQATCWLVLLAGSLVCAMLAAFLCSRREFHVKTPEKS